MKPLVAGDLELLIRAAESSNGEFEVNEQKTKLRCTKEPEKEPELKEDGTPVATAEQVEKFGDHISAVNRKSIYAVSYFLIYESSLVIGLIMRYICTFTNVHNGYLNALHLCLSVYI